MKKIFTLLTAVLVSFSTFAGELTVAEGTNTSEYLPIYAYYGDVATQHSQIIYPASLIKALEGSSISAITFYIAQPAGKALTTVYSLGLAIVEQDQFASDAYLSASTTKVYEGVIDASKSSVTLEFSTPYEYTSGNLLLDIQVKSKGNYDEVYFYGVNGSTNTSARHTTYGAVADPFMPKTTFAYDEASTGTCDKPTRLRVAATPDGGVATWSGETSATYQYCVVDKDAAVGVWTNVAAGQLTQTVAGLIPGKEYDFCVRTDCGESQSDVVRLSFSPFCAAPENLQATDIKANAATFTWDEAAYVNKYQFVCVKKDEAYSFDGVEAKTGKSATISELDDETDYDFYVRSYYSASIVSEPAKISFTTDCAVKKMPYREAFLNTTLPNCWSFENESSYGWKMYTESDPMGSYCMYYSAKASMAKVDVLALPAINLSEAAVVKMLMMNAKGLSIKMLISTDGGATKKELADLSEVVDSPTDKQIDLSAYSGEVRLYFQGTSTGKYEYFYFDNFQVVAKPCTTPTGLAAEPSSTGAVVTWTGSGEAAWNIRYKAVSAAEWTTVNDLSKASYTITGLVSGTEYEVQVQAACSAEKQSSWSSSVKFTPTCPTPSDLKAIVNITDAALSWESLESAFKLQYKAKSAAEWSEEFNVNAKSYTLSDLAAGTDYAVRVQAACGSEYAEIQFTTRCAGKAADDLPYGENFETVAENALPECWFVLPENALASVIAMNEDGDHKLYLSDQTERWVVLPAFATDLAAYSLTFEYTGSCQLEVGYLTGADGAQFVALQAVSASPAQCDLKNMPANALFVAIHYTGTSNWSTAYIDNVKIVESDTLTGIEEIRQGQLQSQKRIIDGVLIIEHNGIRYNAQGAVVK